MHRWCAIFKFFGLSLLINCQLSVVNSFAQEPDNLDKELVLIRPYEPSVSDAQKISILPSLTDSFSIKPAFDYSIRSRRIDTRFDVNPIGAAKLQALPQTKLYHAYIKAGIGTMLNPLAEVSFNTLRNQKYAVGALLKYDGSYGKVKLNNDERVYAGYGESNAKVFAKKFFKSSYLYGDLGASGNRVHHYGYDTRIDTSFAKDDIRQRYTFADANIGIRSSQFKTEQMNYHVKLGYQYAQNKATPHTYDGINPAYYIPENRKYTENAVNLKAEMDNNMFGGRVNFDLYNRNSAFDSLRNNFALDLNPWFMLDNDSIRLEVGMRVAIYKEGDGNLQYKLYPKVEFQFTLLKDIFIPFVGIDGYLDKNTYRKIVEENPFITPGLVFPNTNAKLMIYAGLKGALTTKLSYYLRAEFSTTDDAYFYVNDSAYSLVQNYFTVTTDALNTFSVRGEVYYNPIERLDFFLKANYSGYQPSNEDYAWHKPSFEMEFSAKYNLQHKILLNLDILGVGKRYAKAFNDPLTNYYTLKSVVDFNIGAEYRYTKSLSFFLKLNNLIGAKYYRWNYYPSQRFNAMVGFTYSL